MCSGMCGQRVVVSSWGRATSYFYVLTDRPSMGARADVLRRVVGQVSLVSFPIGSMGNVQGARAALRWVRSCMRGLRRVGRRVLMRR